MPAEWKAVYALVKRMPRGKVIAYGQLARAINLRGGARAAGRAMHACPKGAGVPWHRVLGAGGRILLQEPRAALQRQLLEGEGLRLSGRRVLNYSEHQWQPLKFPRKKRKRGGAAKVRERRGI